MYLFIPHDQLLNCELWPNATEDQMLALTKRANNDEGRLIKLNAFQPADEMSYAAVEALELLGGEFAEIQNRY